MTTDINWELIQKYDRPGPRYTSYPTAPLFNEEVSADALIDNLATSYNSKVPLSLYVHVPFCRKLCWYCGCNMMVSRNRERINSHVEIIKKEMEMLRANIHPNRETCQIHLGGGTPNYLSDDELVDLMFFLRRTYPVSKDAEISIEVDPRQVNPNQIQAIKACGFNRISMGVQDFNSHVQAAINRIQPYEMVSEGVAGFRDAGISSINMDLIYGLPKQSPDSFTKTVDQAISLAPNRIALFNYAHVPSLKPHMKLIKQEDMPAPKDKLRILRQTVEQLIDAGYVYIGMDHFAKPDDPLAKAMETGDLHRNFQGYTTHAETEMLAFGMSAISMFDNLYVQNISKLSSYEDAITSGKLATWRGYKLNDDDRLRRHIINRFMCCNTIAVLHRIAHGYVFRRVLPRCSR